MSEPPLAVADSRGEAPSFAQTAQAKKVCASGTAAVASSAERDVCGLEGE
jgi:hypothetical protein